MATGSATWPQKFVYVCSATMARIVNYAPIWSAGIDRISAVVIFCGAVDPETADSRTRSQSIIPARQLEANLARDSNGRLSVENGSIVTLYGDPSDVRTWTMRMGEVLQSFPPPQPVVFNAKGGVGEMRIGGLIGGAGDNRFVAITTRGDPNRTERISPGPQCALPMIASYPGIHDYLRVYGYEELRHAAPGKKPPRRRWQDFVLRNQRQITAFASTLYVAPALIAECNRIGNACFHKNAGGKKEIFRPETCRPSPAMAEALGLLDNLPGLARRHDEPAAWRIEHQGTAAFLRGKWLEASLYLEVRRRLRGFNDVELASGLHITTPGGTESMAELDLAVLIRGQLQLVEAKTTAKRSARTADDGDKSFAQFESISRLLTGQVGKAFLVNPRLRSLPMIEARAQDVGIEVLLGPDAVTKVVQRLVGLAEARLD